jgi:hypothetical protein
MSLASVPFALGALALFFFVPGYLLVKALWPEKRWKGPEAPITALEMVTGGFLASLGLFLVIGFALGNTGVFQAGPSDPLLEEILLGLSVLFLVVGWVVGAYRKEAPAAPSFVEPPGPGEEDLGPVLDQFQRWNREERDLRREIHRLRREGGSADALKQKQEELDGLRASRRQAEADRQRSLAE